eukprot:Colp12_sorted_trinity150504_noHs@135
MARFLTLLLLVLVTSREIQSAPLESKWKGGRKGLTTTSNNSPLDSSKLMPKVIVEGIPSEHLKARQIVLNTILKSALDDIETHSRTTAASLPPTLHAVNSAYKRWHNFTTGEGSSDPSMMTPYHEVLTRAVIAHTVSVHGSVMMKNITSDQGFMAADQFLGSNRSQECQDLKTYMSGPMGQISKATKDCMCNFTEVYSYCRMLLAHDMDSTTQTVQSSAKPSDIARIASNITAKMNTNATFDVNNRWQPPAYRNGSIGLRENGFQGYNPATGEFFAQGCVGEILEVCIKGGGVLPIFKTAVQTTTQGDELVITQCTSGQCTGDYTASAFLSAFGNNIANAGVEVGVSICLGIPGLVEVLNEFGISLCLNLLTLDLYPLQGPVGQVSAGLSLFVVKLNAFGKIKMANGSPLCPQDFNPSEIAYMCQHQDVLREFVNAFGSNDFCNMNPGQVLVGVSVTVDLWIWSKTWTWQYNPSPKPTPSCGGSAGPTPDDVSGQPPIRNSYYGQFDCYEARAAYLRLNPDVAANSVYGSLVGARNHFNDYGRNEGRVWPGHLCLHQKLTCFAAQLKYWADNTDVETNSVYGEHSVDSNGNRLGAWRHWNDWGQFRDTAFVRAWHGEICLWSDSLICDVADAQYLIAYPDVAENSFYGARPHQHYLDHGKGELRYYNSALCLPSYEKQCDSAAENYLQQYPDVAADGYYGTRQTAFKHYQEHGKAEGRWWLGNLCT